MAAVALTVGAVGCGGDGDDEGPSKADYIEKADRVCADADPKLDEIWRTGGPKPDAKQAQAVLEALAPEERKLLTELRAVEKPAGDQDEIDRMWAARERAVDEMEAAARTPASALAYIESEDDGGEAPGTGRFDEASRLAAEYGMADCEGTVPGSVAAP